MFVKNNEVSNYQEKYRLIQKSLKNSFYEYFVNDKESVNLDYFLALNKTGKEYVVSKIEIKNEFQDITNFLESVLNYKNFSTELPKIIYDFIVSFNIVEKSNEIQKEILVDDFNYCVNLSGKYLQKISVSLSGILDNFKEDFDNNIFLYKNMFYYEYIKLDLLKKGYYIYHHETNNFNKIFQYVFYSNRRFIATPFYTKNYIIKKSFDEFMSVNKNLILDFCSYILYWIRAYKLNTSIRDFYKNNKNCISFSHRYQGWSQPSFKISDDLTAEFHTNFGYGNSSYFCLTLIYKDIKIVSFTDWINYPIANAGQILQYTKKFHDVYNRNKNIDKVNNNQWSIAMDYLKNACNSYLIGERNFVEKYVVESLNNMISELNSILKIKISDFNHKDSDDFHNKFSIRKYNLINTDIIRSAIFNYWI